MNFLLKVIKAYAWYKKPYNQLSDYDFSFNSILNHMLDRKVIYSRSDDAWYNQTAIHVIFNIRRIFMGYWGQNFPWITAAQYRLESVHSDIPWCRDRWKDFNRTDITFLSCDESLALYPALVLVGNFSWSIILKSFLCMPSVMFANILLIENVQMLPDNFFLHFSKKLMVKFANVSYNLFLGTSSHVQKNLFSRFFSF